MIQQLDWDSAFFKIKVGKIEVESVENLESIFSRQSAFDLLYLFVPPGLIEPKKVEQSFRNCVWVDNKLTFTKMVSYGFNPTGNKQVRTADISHYTEGFQSLAFESGKFSRFRMDERFSDDAFKALYSEWMKKSLSREIALEVFYIENNGVEAGMVTVGEKNGRLDIGLIAVDERFQGQGLGSVLLKKVEAYAFGKGFREIQVVTQGKNLAACNFYKKNGFSVNHEVNIFHVWKH